MVRFDSGGEGFGGVLCGCMNPLRRCAPRPPFAAQKGEDSPPLRFPGRTPLCCRFFVLGLFAPCFVRSWAGANVGLRTFPTDGGRLGSRLRGNDGAGRE